MAFRQFYEDTRDTFFKYVMRLSGDYDIASDLMQESYFKYYHSYEPPYKKALLYRIAYNVFVDGYRKSKRNVSLNESEIELQSSAATPDKQYEQQKMLDLLQRLPETDRNLLSMAVSESLTYQQMSETTGLSVANIKIKIHRARKSLKAMMGD